MKSLCEGLGPQIKELQRCDVRFCDTNTLIGKLFSTLSTADVIHFVVPSVFTRFWMEIKTQSSVSIGCQYLVKCKFGFTTIKVARHVTDVPKMPNFCLMSETGGVIKHSDDPLL